MVKKLPMEGGPTFSLKHRLVRLLWQTTWLLLCRWSPPQMWRWRRFFLRLFGAAIGEKSDVRGSARVWYPPNLLMADNTLLAAGVNCYNPAPIRIETGCLVSQGAYLCAASHNVTDSAFPLVLRPITLGKDSWIASEAFVGPGVNIGQGTVLGARGAAFEDLNEWTIYRGNPARAVRPRSKLPQKAILHNRSSDG